MVTVVASFTFGGTTGKKRVRRTVTIVDATNGMTVGGTAGDIPASAFELTKIESCSNIVAYTTSSGAATRVYPASPDLAGTSILASTGASATDTEAARTAIADVTLSTTESMMLTVEGYR